MSGNLICEVRIVDKKRQEAALKLLKHAHKYWNACHSEGQFGAVQWVIGEYGELIIFTRGEYRNRLMANISTLADEENVHLFGEQIPSNPGE